ncbi:AMP-binding protein [Pusillimonas sp. ANT_WB101]|uniref:AMP-binding protein n=1 Tax=Pusillimonas sp. ANT_WB101 TaxID=2597356 RepID=UPI0011F090E0|nr:AMP-binding protein [Pusillimonas sp. ANT_WB101]KAA0889415.1 AMP-binding protein [Pusillimonas sp. ANT_WB101]
MASPHTAVHGGSTTAQLYAQALQHAPDNPAIVSGDKTLTYAELAHRSWQTVRVLQQQGLQRRDTVALLIGNRMEAIIALIAVHWLGLRYLALHPLASQEDHCFVLEDAEVKALIADTRQHAERAEALRSSVPLVVTLDDTRSGPGLINLAEKQDGTPLELPDDPSEISKLAYTGGTTGRSKGIRHTHRTAVTLVMQALAAYEWPDTPKYLVTTPISHAAGSLLIPVFLKGGTVYLMEKYSSAAFFEHVQKHRINLSFLVPTQIYGLLDDPAPDQSDSTSLELVLYGAAPITPVRLAQALGKFGPVFGQIYGQAEAPMTICYLSPKEHDLMQPHRLQSCGRPIPGNQVQLLDANLSPVPVGEIGELCVRGPLVMDGYLNRPEEDAKVFEGGWLHTGDMARADAEGYLYLVDRSKDMIITGGFNVFPSEVENCLAQHPQVAISAVIGIPHEKWGEEVTAIVVLKPDAECDEHEIITYVTEHKGVVHAPKKVIFTDQLPLTAVGKIDKKTLRARYWSVQNRQIN